GQTPARALRPFRWENLSPTARLAADGQERRGGVFGIMVCLSRGSAKLPAVHRASYHILRVPTVAHTDCAPVHNDRYDFSDEAIPPTAQRCLGDLSNVRWCRNWAQRNEPARLRVARCRHCTLHCPWVAAAARSSDGAERWLTDPVHRLLERDLTPT